MSRDERGAATLLVVSALALLMWLTCAAAVVVRLVADHRRVQAAADLAALAGAVAASAGEDACGAAAGVASRNGARLVACVEAADSVRVTTSIESLPLLGSRPVLSAEARAGPE